MKTATIPAMRVEPKLREAAQSVLVSGETLSSFVEESLRANIERRLYNQAFIARGIASRDDAIATKEYYSAESVLGELAEMKKQQGQLANTLLVSATAHAHQYGVAILNHVVIANGLACGAY